MHNYWKQQRTNARVSLITGIILMLANSHFQIDLLSAMAAALTTGGIVLYRPARRGEQQAALLDLTRAQLQRTYRRRY